VHECEGPTRLNSRPRRYLFTGHSNGTVQLWDLTTALELKPCDQTYLGGPSASEFVRLLDQCELAINSSGSGYSTPTTSNQAASYLSPSYASLSVLSGRLYNKNLLVNLSTSNLPATILSQSQQQAQAQPQLQTQCEDVEKV
jgi:hypothetical protein